MDISHLSMATPIVLGRLDGVPIHFHVKDEWNVPLVRVYAMKRANR